jgi:hypothetical protein
LGVNLFDVRAFNVGPPGTYAPFQIPFSIDLLGVDPSSVCQLYIRRPNPYPCPAGRKLKGRTPKRYTLKGRKLKGCMPKRCKGGMSQGGSVWAGSGVSKATPLLVLHLAPSTLPLFHHWRAALQSTWTLKDGSQSSYAISTKNGIRHKRNFGTRKALAPEKC